MKIKVPRLTLFLLISIVLMAIAYCFRESDPLISVSLYKAHLMSLGGWGGYWLDRAVFTSARPHMFNLSEPDGLVAFSFAGLRRAVIIAASLICVGIGA